MNRQYIGARYVPKFADPIEWNINIPYEPLTIVTHLNNTYTSKKYVPPNTNIFNTEFWVMTSNFNDQLTDLFEKTEKINESLKNTTTFVTPEMFGAVGDGVNDDSNAFQEAINTNKTVLLSSKTYVCGNLRIPNGTKIVALSGLQEYGAGANIKVVDTLFSSAREDKYIDALFLYGIRFIGNYNNYNMFRVNDYLRWSNIFCCSFLSFDTCLNINQVLGLRMAFCNINDSNRFIKISCSDSFFSHIFAQSRIEANTKYDSFIDIHASTSVFECLYLTGLNGVTSNLFALRGYGTNINIINSTFDCAKEYGLCIKPNEGEPKSSNIIITGNTFRSNGYLNTTNSSDAYITANKVIFSNNKFSKYPQVNEPTYNISFINSQYSKIFDNVSSKNEKILIESCYAVSFSSLNIDSNVITISNNVKYYKSNNSVNLNINGYSLPAKNIGESINIGTLNNGYRPFQTMFFNVYKFYVKINTNGVIQVFYNESTSTATDIYVSCVFDGYYFNN